MEITRMTPEQRRDAARLAHGYQEQAGRARQAEAEKSSETRKYAESARRFARDLLDRYGLDVENELHRHEIRKLLAGPGSVLVAVHHDTLSTGETHPFTLEANDGLGDDFQTFAFAVPAETAERWHEIQLAWTDMQQQMKRAWERAQEVAEDHEEVQGLLSHYQYSDELDEIRAKEAAQEAEWDKEYGLREWAVTTFRHRLSKHRHEVRGRIHKQGCPSLVKVWDNSPYDPVHVVSHIGHGVKLLRRHDAIKVLREGTQGMRTIVVCQRCAKGLECDAESVTQDETQREHDEWMDSQTWAPDGI